MKVSFWRLALPYFDDNDGAGAGAPAAGATPPAATGGNPSTSSPGAAAATPPPAPAPSAFTYKEDRSNWVPSHRIRQESERAAKLERELEFERQRVAALSGVKHTPAPNPERDRLKAELYEIAPELKEITEYRELLAEIKELKLKETLGTLQASHNQTWAQRGNATLNSLAESVREVYGAAGKDLSPKAIQRIQRAFIAEIEADDEMRGRYEAGDPSIVEEFVKDFTGGLLDPYRRSTAAAVVTPGQQAARRLPRGGGGSAVAGPPARTVKPSDGDAFHKSAFERFQQGR